MEHGAHHAHEDEQDELTAGPDEASEVQRTPEHEEDDSAEFEDEPGDDEPEFDEDDDDEQPEGADDEAAPQEATEDAEGGDPAPAAKPSAPGQKACACALYEVVDLSSNTVVETTECHGTTSRTFAPGHDAKLKSMLIRAGVRGYAVREVGTLRAIKPLAVGHRYGFGSQVERGIWARLGSNRP